MIAPTRDSIPMGKNKTNQHTAWFTIVEAFFIPLAALVSFHWPIYLSVLVMFFVAAFIYWLLKEKFWEKFGKQFDHPVLLSIIGVGFISIFVGFGIGPLLNSVALVTIVVISAITVVACIFLLFWPQYCVDFKLGMTLIAASLCALIIHPITLFSLGIEASVLQGSFSTWFAVVYILSIAVNWTKIFEKGWNNADYSTHTAINASGGLMIVLIRLFSWLGERIATELKAQIEEKRHDSK